MVLKMRPDRAFRQPAVILVHASTGKVYYGASRYDF